jgi:intermediate filament protein if
MTSRTSYGQPPSAALALITTGGAGAVKSTRDKEKKDMQDLNERFASYIEKVRFLEAQNRRLADELEKLKSKWGKETTQIKAMYETELAEAKRLLDEAEKEKARLEQRVAALEDQLEELRRKLEEAKKAAAEIRDKIEQQNQQMSDYEAEISLLRRRVEGLGGDRDKDKKQIAQLQDALNRARIDLDNETLLHIDAENRRQTLEEELEFLKQVHEQEMKELAALAYRDTTSENREFWKNEMGQALRDIQQVYDDKLDGIRNDMDTYYNLKVQEFRTGATRGQMDAIHTKEETTRLKSQLQDLRNKLNDLEARNIQLQRELDALRREKEERERELENENGELKNNVAKMRAELEAIMKELQDLMDTKLGLELEIAAYRKLLEGEEDRIGLKQVVDSMYGAFSSIGEPAPTDSTTIRQVVKGEMTAKTTHQRSAKGPTAIGDCSADGKFVTLENTGRKEESLGKWKVARNIDGREGVSYTLDENFALKPGAKVRLWAIGSLPPSANPETDIQVDVDTWGVGNNVTTKLINPAGEDRATHVQRTVMS